MLNKFLFPLQESPSANAIEEPFLFNKDDEVHVP